MDLNPNAPEFIPQEEIDAQFDHFIAEQEEINAQFALFQAEEALALGGGFEEESKSDFYSLPPPPGPCGG